jgi:hypothetical protein
MWCFFLWVLFLQAYHELSELAAAAAAAEVALGETAVLASSNADIAVQADNNNAAAAALIVRPLRKSDLKAALVKIKATGADAAGFEKKELLERLRKKRDLASSLTFAVAADNAV